jgi:DNA-binding phage protein
MPLTRQYKETVIARIKEDPKFAAALFVEATNCFFEGETAEALSIFRDLVHAKITFKELASQTGFGEKSLHRMLASKGNPTVRNFSVITKTIARVLKLTGRLQFTPQKEKRRKLAMAH